MFYQFDFAITEMDLIDDITLGYIIFNCIAMLIYDYQP